MAYKFPGVYPTIRDASGIVVNNAVTSCGYVGEAEYGPVLTPTLISNLQEFSNIFGTLNSKYGYAGYSLAVAAETINQHYFVRVVPTGEKGAHTADDATWASGYILKTDSTISELVGKGYYYEEITTAENSRDNSPDGDSGLFKDDTQSSMIVAATNPNNRKFFVSIADSTINENRAYSVSSMSLDSESGEEDTTEVTVTIQVDPKFDANYYTNDLKIVVSRMKNSALNGTFDATPVIVSRYAAGEDGAKGGEIKVISFIYTVDGDQSQSAEGYIDARVGLYPELNQRTFSLTVSEKVGRVIQTLESFDYCTLYHAKDNYGESMFVEDVVNGSSNYVQVFVNHNYGDTIIIPKPVNDVELVGGNSGSYKNREDQKYIDMNKAWDLFKDRSQLNVSLLLNSGYVTKDNVSYQSKMLEVAEYRRDCFCLFDIPMTLTDYEDISDWRKNIQGFNSYRGAVSAPWVKTYDSIQGRSNFVMCPSAYIAKIIGAFDPWIAPAGLNRGVLTASTVSPIGLTKYYNDVEGGNLYTDNQINCIVRNPAAGYVNWGQRTLQQKPSALDRINVARTVIYIETILRDAAKWHVFENNTAYERMQLTLQFSSFLDTVLSADGIQRYSVICDESNNTPQVIGNNQLAIDIYLWPSYTAEFIIISSTINGADTTVNVSTGQ